MSGIIKLFDIFSPSKTSTKNLKIEENPCDFYMSPLLNGLKVSPTVNIVNEVKDSHSSVAPASPRLPIKTTDAVLAYAINSDPPHGGVWFRLHTHEWIFCSLEGIPGRLSIVIRRCDTPPIASISLSKQISFWHVQKLLSDVGSSFGEYNAEKNNCCHFAKSVQELFSIL